MKIYRLSITALVAVGLSACGGGVTQSSSTAMSQAASSLSSPSISISSAAGVNNSSISSSFGLSSESFSSSATQALVIEENQMGFCAVDGVVENTHAGFTGTGYANAANAVASGITWKINAREMGSYTLAWRYANGGAAARVAGIYVGGLSQGAVAFEATDLWTNYQTQSVTVSLLAGENTLYLTAESDAGLPNIDALWVMESGVTAVACTLASSSEGVVSSVASSSSVNNPNPQACETGTTQTQWADSCPTTATNSCTAGTWSTTPTGSDGQPLRYESEHFAFYWPDGTNIDIAGAQQAATTLEMIWDKYFNSAINFPEPYCDSATKYKATIHFDNEFPLWGGAWNYQGISIPGMWVGPSAANDQWGLAHEFMHGVQSLTPAFPDCGGSSCWIYESHANWMPHQIFRDNVHCSEMLANSAHLHYGNTRNRYCNWQFFEYIKDKHCPSAVNQMWTASAPSGQGDPFQKLMNNQGWDIEQLNDTFGEWAMHNVTWDYRNPDGTDQGAVYRSAYGNITDTASNYTQRRLRLTQLEALDYDWQQTRRFNAPFYWAPQRWGYNVTRLYPEAGAQAVTINFRGVTQAAANSGWRWGLVVTDSQLQNPRYSRLKRDVGGELSFCITDQEIVFLVVLAAPTQYQKIVWQQPMDGTAYPSIYRYPYMVEIKGAWPEGFNHGVKALCPSGTVRHSNGGGCALVTTPSSVYVGPYAKILGGSVSENARIENQATIINGTVTGNATVGALTLLGVASNPHHGAASFNVTDDASVLSAFYPMGWFGNNLTAAGSAVYKGDLEAYSSKSENIFYGLVDDGATGVNNAPEVTTPPPYQWY